MDANKKRIMDICVARTIDNLKKNNMEAVFLPTKEDVVPMLEKLVEKGSSISLGGSVTLNECGVLSFVRRADYKFIDRYDKSVPREEIVERLREGLLADVMISSSNAVTERGELFNIDGTGNRVAGLVFGPKKVIIVVGVNKLVRDLREAFVRTKTVACPSNCVRLEKETFCSRKGICCFSSFSETDFMVPPAGACENGICSSYVVMAKQQFKGRVTVLIVGDELGY